MNKETFMIGEAAHLAGVHPSTIRRYIKRGLLPEPPRMWNGWRIFNEKHVIKIKELINGKI
ncbi:MAG: MerR family DNA-binding transcriptional regulator [Candidatus Velamenicoccus archaeovorus]